ncbi:LPXTG cell wall anchor domain-containing protein [Streptococcus gallolyticus]|uniref:LPXTG cell wall anchor domain-containing protein n=1 Tax=Streptococcus gallolyticus TaxID=315405 RepID=UPI0022841F7E|nr:LPXTG cell wall anchor domain-containing protein [Streptococcus gallolyticus]MCY7190722.1 LPXTG cell wall anchor domain-containing protein [Streptococcus gallolyticus subsp. gallolyticus]
MKKVIISHYGLPIVKLMVILVVGILVLGISHTVQALTREEVAENLAINVEDGLSSEEYFALGQQYETGDGVVQWYAKALAYYKAAEEQGLVEARTAIDNLNAYKAEVLADGDQGAIFTFYRTGVTASQKGDYEQAFAIYYDDSFFFEDPQDRGLGGLADLYLAGDGVEQNVSSAMSIYEVMAVEQGKGNGYTALGNIYAAATGTYPGVNQSNDTALKYYLLSFQSDNLTATDFKGPRYAANFYDSGFYHDDGTWENPNYTLAEEYYLIAVAGNGRTFDGTAAYKLGTYYEYGREGIAQDYSKAVYYYEKALSDSNVHSTMLGIPDTYLALGRFYENGLGVAIDLEKALSYYYQAQAAAQDNLDLGGNVAGYEAALKVYQEATEAIQRLTQGTNDTETTTENQQTTTDDTTTETTSGDENQEVVTLSDATTGVSVIGTQAALSNAVTVVVMRTTVAALKDLNYDAYDITLQDASGNEVQPSEAVQVILPATYEVSALYHVANDDSLTSVDVIQNGNKVTFTTSHFSIYAVVYKEQIALEETSSDVAVSEPQKKQLNTLPKTGSQSSKPLTFIGVALVMILSVFTINYFLKQKNNE